MNFPDMLIDDRATVRSAIKAAVAESGHRLGRFHDGLSVCEHCGSVMDEDDARDYLHGDQDALGTFKWPCDPRATALISYAWQLEPGEALAVPGIQLWAARTKAGALRVGFGWASVAWHLSDEPARLIAEHLRIQLDRSQMGYFADQFRREVDLWLANPVAFRLTNVGRVVQIPEPGTTRKLLGVAA